MKIKAQTNEIMELREGALFKRFLAVILFIVAIGGAIVNGISSDNIVLFLILIAGGLFLFLMTKEVKVKIDKLNNLVIRKEKSFFKKNTEKINISDIDHVNVKETRSYTNYDDSSTGTETTYSYEIYLVLKNNTRFLLNYQSSSRRRRFLFWTKKASDQKTGEKIAQFLSIPYKETYEN